MRPLNSRARFGINLLAPFEDAFGVLGDVVEAIPGSEWVLGVGEEGLGALRTLANLEIEGLPVGMSILRAMTGTFITPQLAQIVGPQLASITIAIPGLIKGDCFIDAYIKEASWRIQTLVAVVGAVPELKSRANKVAEDFANELKRLAADPRFRALFERSEIEGVKVQAGVDTRGAIERLKRTPADLEREFSARQDAIALTINMLLCERVYRQEEFAAGSGAPKRKPFSTPDSRTAQQLSIDLQLAIARKAPEAEIARLRELYTLRKDAEDHADESAYLLRRLDGAKARGTSEVVIRALQTQYENALAREYAEEIARGEAGFAISYGLPGAEPNLKPGEIGFMLGPPPVFGVSFQDPATGADRGVGIETLKGVGVLALLLSPIWVPALFRFRKIS